MIGIDKTDQWDEENAGKPLSPTRQQLEARIANLEVDYARAEKIAVNLHAITKKAMDRIAELEAERSDYITETEALVIRVRGENATRIAELEAEIISLKTAVTEWGDAIRALPIPSPPAEKKTP
jgi:chromosome segregation ATPase